MFDSKRCRNAWGDAALGWQEGSMSLGKLDMPQKVSRELASLRKLGANPRTASAKSSVTGAQRSASKKPPQKAPSKELSRTVEKRLDDAVADSFPCSDPVSFLQAAPIKQGDRPLCTVKVNKRVATSRAGER
jgi:hypothetical protein